MSREDARWWRPTSRETEAYRKAQGRWHSVHVRYSDSPGRRKEVQVPEGLSWRFGRLWPRSGLRGVIVHDGAQLSPYPRLDRAVAGLEPQTGTGLACRYIRPPYRSKLYRGSGPLLSGS
jgi:hypothetical protein